jgi:putative acetyltransferase
VRRPLTDPRRANHFAFGMERLFSLIERQPLNVHCLFARILDEGQGHVALGDGRLVGWCDIQPSFGQAREHVGVLGMGRF